MSSTNLWITLGAIFSGLAVAFGAFGAHSLQDILSADRLSTFETAVRYQMYHGLALLLLGIISQNFTSTILNYIGYGFTLGIIIFSGSLYILVITDTSWLGAITPIGGLFFILSWGLLAHTSIIEGRN